MAISYKTGIFDDEGRFLAALHELHDNKTEIFDVYTPYPVHEVFHLLERKSKLPTAAYFFGLFGIIATLGFLYYTSVVNWPVVYGGKPLNSFPSFIVVTIVITILTVTIASLALFSARSKLFPGRDNTIFDERATDNMFVIVTGPTESGSGNSNNTTEILTRNGALEVKEKIIDKVLA